ncbi:hypothetical protein ACFDWB_003849 [Salmonella enterica]|nr:hypothetical protein [Salmonella enterica subsp. enterica serovar Glostrup]EHG3080345.1 hypothetical protein [Salmonella enterica]EIG1925272.1 hypothetical protein [Salmonella enterica]EJI4683215.1 hypothetical protein [Salmonella enterica]EKR9561727.1 hypothetical protein [Salmonella enterica]
MSQHQHHVCCIRKRMRHFNRASDKAAGTLMSPRRSAVAFVRSGKQRD